MSVEQNFSQRAKNELCRVEDVQHNECFFAEIAAASQASGSLVLRQGTGALEIRTETAAFARRLFALLKGMTGYNPEIRAVSTSRLHKHKTYVVSLGEGALDLLKQAGVWDGMRITQGVPASVHDACCIRAYLRSMFLCSGSATDPKKAYHIEMVLRDETLAQSVVRLLEQLDIPAKVTARKDSYVVYMKDADAISDFWANIGAYNAMLEHEDTRIMKQVRNDVNRAVNCETANVQKTVNAALHQRDCIDYLARRGLLEKMPQALREAADARLSHPEASIAELAALMSPPIGKSGMSHRLRKLCETAENEGYAEA